MGEQGGTCRMKFTKYDSIESFGLDTLDILLENEVQNNLPISFIFNEHEYCFNEPHGL